MSKVGQSDGYPGGLPIWAEGSFRTEKLIVLTDITKAAKRSILLSLKDLNITLIPGDRFKRKCVRLLL